MSIAAANVAPNFGFRRSITSADLQRVDDLCVVMEYHALDSDLQPFWCYTVGGVLDGVPLEPPCTVAGEVITISGVSTREEADGIASAGLLDTVRALDEDQRRHQEAQAALGRLASISPIDRLDLATRAPADKSDAFERDRLLIEPLKGEDIVLAAGEVSGGDKAVH